MVGVSGPRRLLTGSGAPATSLAGADASQGEREAYTCDLGTLQTPVKAGRVKVLSDWRTGDA